MRRSGLPILCLLAACASTDAGTTLRRPEVPWADLWPALARPDAEVGGDGAFPARRPDAAALAALQAAERAYRARDDAAFAAARDDLAAAPLSAFWLARMLIRDALFLRERARADTEAMVGDPPWQRPVDQLVAMGGAAAPCVVLDLLRQREADLRDFGADILGAMGPPALAAWERTFDLADPLVRRYAVHAVTGWSGDPHAFELLMRATGDPDFGVRAQAWRGIAAWGPDQGPRLRAALAAESDPFVQRAIVEGLAEQPDIESAAAVVGFLESSARASDREGFETAQRALWKLSGRTAVDSVVGWRRWLDERRRAAGG